MDRLVVMKFHKNIANRRLFMIQRKIMAIVLSSYNYFGMFRGAVFSGHGVLIIHQMMSWYTWYILRYNTRSFEGHHRCPCSANRNNVRVLIIWWHLDDFIRPDSLLRLRHNINHLLTSAWRWLMLPFMIFLQFYDESRSLWTGVNNNSGSRSDILTSLDVVSRCHCLNSLHRTNYLQTDRHGQSDRPVTDRQTYQQQADFRHTTLCNAKHCIRQQARSIHSK